MKPIRNHFQVSREPTNPFKGFLKTNGTLKRFQRAVRYLKIISMLRTHLDFVLHSIYDILNQDLNSIIWLNLSCSVPFFSLILKFYVISQYVIFKCTYTCRTHNTTSVCIAIDYMRGMRAFYNIFNTTTIPY